MKREREKPIKIRSISIRNYKGIDALDIKFPQPRLEGDPDIFVIGSQNGIGKTSIIECCALLLLGPSLRKVSSLLPVDPLNAWPSILRKVSFEAVITISDLLIRSGKSSAEISGELVIGDDTITLNIQIEHGGRVKVSGEHIEKFFENEWTVSESDADRLIKAICGFTANPVIRDNFLLFHSYRKVQEGNPEMGMMVQESRMLQNYQPTISAFKLQMLRSMMGKANLFESNEEKGSNETIETLNKLIKTYAGGTISKLRPSPDNRIDFRVNPVGKEGSFTFDGLSSGQKEIISTLFLIWHHTKNCPSVVFIDEPELHLNAQWHRRFVKHLIALAPNNQYIIATHSEGVMDSVDKDRRALLSSDQGMGE